VLSPRQSVLSVHEIFDGETDKGYSVALIDWEGNKCIGIRWNLTKSEWESQEKISGKKKCVGEPNSRGFPTWFILPTDFLKDILNRDSEISTKVRELLKDLPE